MCVPYGAPFYLLSQSLDVYGDTIHYLLVVNLLKTGILFTG